MTVQIRNDKQALRVELPASGEVDMPKAIELARDLIDAVTQCGFEVKMNVEVPRHKPSDIQIATAIQRVGHLRKNMVDKPWNDVGTNTELVRRVLEACL
jgi:hypothetical protein